MKSRIVNIENVPFRCQSHAEGFECHKIRKGDFISLPPGRDSAHQIVNDSKAPLRYLAVSTREQPEVVEYPDSGKVAVIADWPGGGRPAPDDAIRHITRLKDGADYWEGKR